MKQSDTRTYVYTQEGNSPLSVTEIYKVFNNYRIWKYVFRTLMALNKTRLPEYTILEPGCGGGEKLRFLTEYRVRPENCYGFDLSEKGIELCRQLSPGTMHFQVGSIFDMPFPDVAFDIILCSGFFSCFKTDEEIRSISAILKRAMKQDGILFIMDPNENFRQVYSYNRTVLQKGFRSFDSATGELDNLLGDEFALFSHRYIIGSDFYGIEGKVPAGPEHFPEIDHLIDQHKLPCGYSLWTFLKKQPGPPPSGPERH